MKKSNTDRVNEKMQIHSAFDVLFQYANTHQDKEIAEKMMDNLETLEKFIFKGREE